MSASCLAVAALVYDWNGLLIRNKALELMRPTVYVQRSNAKLPYNRQVMLELCTASGSGTVDTNTLDALHSLGLLSRRDPAAQEAAESPTSTGCS